MKTELRKIGIITITTAILISFQAFADGAKGGGSALLDLSGKRPIISEKSTAKFMECAKCSTEQKVVVVRDNRGGVVRSVPTAIHSCPSCKTTAILVGHGKAKVESRTHSCGTVQAMACCAK